MEIIYLKTDNVTHKTYKSNFNTLPNFKNHIDGKLKNEEILLDMDFETVNDILQYLRTGEKPPYHVKKLIEKINDGTFIFEDKFVRLEMGMGIFYTTEKTLLNSSYFSSKNNFDKSKEGTKSSFIDCDYNKFKILLSYLRNDEYPIIEKNIKFELNYFGVFLDKTFTLEKSLFFKLMSMNGINVIKSHMRLLEYYISKNEMISSNCELCVFDNVILKITVKWDVNLGKVIFLKMQFKKNIPVRTFNLISNESVTKKIVKYLNENDFKEKILSIGFEDVGSHRNETLFRKGNIFFYTKEIGNSNIRTINGKIPKVM